MSTLLSKSISCDFTLEEGGTCHMQLINKIVVFKGFFWICGIYFVKLILILLI